MEVVVGQLAVGVIGSLMSTGALMGVGGYIGAPGAVSLIAAPCLLLCLLCWPGLGVRSTHSILPYI